MAWRDAVAACLRATPDVRRLSFAHHRVRVHALRPALLRRFPIRNPRTAHSVSSACPVHLVRSAWVASTSGPRACALLGEEHRCGAAVATHWRLPRATQACAVPSRCLHSDVGGAGDSAHGGGAATGSVPPRRGSDTTPANNFSWLTTKAAKRDFLLRERDLEGLPFRTRVNPYFPEAPRMRLFRHADVVARSVARWGSLQGLHDELMRRAAVQERRRVARLNDAAKALPVSAGAARAAGAWQAVKDGAGAAGSVVRQFICGVKGLSGLRSVRVAAATNAVVCGFKFAGAAYSGSASMLSEALHSAADVVNQVLLGVGIISAEQRADGLHPCVGCRCGCCPCGCCRCGCCVVTA